MTKHDAIIQLVPQPHNSASEALLYAALITAAAVGIYWLAGWTTCKLSDRRYKRLVKENAQ